MASALADQIVACVKDAQRMWPHNHDLINDERVEQAVMAAISNCAVTPTEELTGTSVHPRLLLVNPDLAAMSLLDAVEMFPLPRMDAPCDRCQRQVPPVARLWVPAGASVVEVQCCLDCTAELHHDFGNVVWR